MKWNDRNVEELSGVGAVLARKLNRLSVFTAFDLIYHYPRRYEDFSRSKRIADLIEKVGSGGYGNFLGEKIESTIAGVVVEVENKKTRRRGFTVTEVKFADDSGTIKVVWFNQPFLKKSLFPGKRLILNGKVYFDRFSKSVVMESPSRSIGAKIVPIYPVTEGISSFMIKKLVAEALEIGRAHV